jgi:hypothetical protein
MAESDKGRVVDTGNLQQSLKYLEIQAHSDDFQIASAARKEGQELSRNIRADHGDELYDRL